MPPCGPRCVVSTLFILTLLTRLFGPPRFVGFVRCSRRAACGHAVLGWHLSMAPINCPHDWLSVHANRGLPHLWRRCSNACSSVQRREVKEVDLMRRNRYLFDPSQATKFHSSEVRECPKSPCVSMRQGFFVVWIRPGQSTQIQSSCNNCFRSLSRGCDQLMTNHE